MISTRVRGDRESVTPSPTHLFLISLAPLHSLCTPRPTGINYEDLLASYMTTGFQATGFAQAVVEINRMLAWRLTDEPVAETEDDDMKSPEARAKVKATIYLGYTSNMISCGVREIIRYLCQHKLVDAIVTTGGGVEEDFMKCFTPAYMGDFNLSGATLRKKGINRIGNTLVPNNNYVQFEKWIMPILDQLVDEQKTRDPPVWTPSAIINRLGKEVNDERSVYYWCWKNDIPVYCPAITDGSVGDMMFFHQFNRPGLIVDLIQDIRGINCSAMQARKTGMIVLGGGVVKHHICNANLMRNGADFAVFVNTGHEFDGSDAGARPDEAVSWGKIKMDARPVKVCADATLIFPLLVAQTFARVVEEGKAASAAASASSSSAAASAVAPASAASQP
jgi:deoxyhypusine synthase